MNLFRYFIFALSLCLYLFTVTSCGSSQKQTDQKATAVADTADTADTDTTPQAPPPPPPGPAPDHVKVTGKIVELLPENGDKTQGTILLKIISVESYGSSTPPVALSDTLRVYFSGKNNAEIQKLIGKIVSAMISYRETPFPGETSTPWYLANLQPGNR